MMGVNSVIHPSLSPLLYNVPPLAFHWKEFVHSTLWGGVNLAKAAKKRQKAPAGSFSSVHRPEMARAVTFALLSSCYRAARGAAAAFARRI